MEELKKELEKLSKAYVDTPENEEKILIPFIKRLLELPMKDRRKLLPLIRELQWIKGRFAGFSSETTCSTFSIDSTVCMCQQTGDGYGISCEV